MGLIQIQEQVNRNPVTAKKIHQHSDYSFLVV